MRRIVMNKYDFYTTEYISGVMSLRKPQHKSLEILENILNHVHPTNNMDLEAALKDVNRLYPICADFERDFMSLAFVLATGVGKTRLIGTFITYLYTRFGMKNFFVVAPGKTVYDKLKQDLGNPSNPKYVFQGLGCFEEPPRVIADEDYRNQNISLLDTDIKIFVFNISKFDKEDTKMRAINEYLGDSFFSQLAQLDDLVLIMDESHHYHAAKGSLALNELKPVLGLELTATPYYNKGSRQVQFKNAVYEYPLSSSIRDGYTRTPYAVTRRDVNFKNFGDKELDRTMLADALLCHENIKDELAFYAKENNIERVKPFIMVVCKDTNHATEIYDYVTSDAFSNGDYKEKTLIIHSNQSKAKREDNISLLLEVEKYENPIEIVIHVDMLKEGWDVNNLYTIVPLRTAASKILREQMVGRGLRLPYGERTGVKQIDSVMLTAHENFDELLGEAQKGDSIFKVGNVIHVEDLVKKQATRTEMAFDYDDEEKNKDDALKLGLNDDPESISKVRRVNKILQKTSQSSIVERDNRKTVPKTEEVVEKVIDELRKGPLTEDDFSELPILSWIEDRTSEYLAKTMNKFIPIPELYSVDEGVEEYKFVDFDFDLSEMNYVPVGRELLIQNLERAGERVIIRGQELDFSSYAVEKELLGEIRKKPEIDYEKCSDLLFKLIHQVVDYCRDKFGEDGMKNVVMMNKKDIANKIYRQMISPSRFYVSSGEVKEEVVGVSTSNLPTNYHFTVEKDLFEEPEGALSSNLFVGIQKGVFGQAKFDSRPELLFARIIEQDLDVLNWLRPNAYEFKIFYNRGRRYVPDFVVETEDEFYLVEIKGEDKLNDVDVLAKKERALQYCSTISEWAREEDCKAWKYLFIPSGQITSSTSFMNLAMRFEGM